METLQFPIRSSHHVIQQNKFCIYLFSLHSLYSCGPRVLQRNFFLFEFLFTIHSLYSCGPGVLQQNLTRKNKQFRLLLRSMAISYIKGSSASRTCHLWVLLEPLVHLLSCRHHLSRPQGQHKVLPISE